MNVYNKKFKFIETSTQISVDAVCAAISLFAAREIRFQDGAYGVDLRTMGAMLVAFIVIELLFNFFANGYDDYARRGKLKEAVLVMYCCIVQFVLAGFLIYAFRMEEKMSRLVLGFAVVIYGILDYLVRLAVKAYLQNVFRGSKESEKILIVTTKSELPNVVRHLEEDGGWSYKIVGIAVTDADMRGQKTGAYDVIATKADAIDCIRSHYVDTVIVNCPSADVSELSYLVQSVLAMGVVCHNCMDRLGVDAPHVSVGKIIGMPVMSYALVRFDYRKRMIKRVFDFFVGLFGSLITVLLTPFIGLAIKIDSPGPIMFSQTRIGKNGRRFKMYKFRSMYIDAEERKKELMAQNEVQGLMFKMENDPRITKVGAFLRKTSLDELPQFYNILLGDMSLVGTRPPTVDEFEQYNVYYRRRLSITPGLTGMWQVSGRSDIKDFEDVVKLDLEYIDNWGLREDIKIMFKTVGVVLGRKGSR